MMESQLNRDSISNRVQYILESISEQCICCGRSPESVRMMAVTKTVKAPRVNEAIAAGVTLLGENKAQELCEKYEHYDRLNTEVHFIGHLQSNKVRQIIDKVTMIESLDSISLAQEIQRQCIKHNRSIDCLIEVNIGGEASKSGVCPEALSDFLGEMSGFDRIMVRGIMAIPPVCEQDLPKERHFEALYKLFIDNRDKTLDNINMDYLSMGMSEDYLLAIKHGSTQVRLGSILFGERSRYA